MIKKIKYIFFLFLILLSCSSESNDANNTEEPNSEEVSNNEEETDTSGESLLDTEGSSVDKGDYELVFSESFDTDLSNWKVWNGGAFNNEIQLYREEQLVVNEGVLSIKTKREAITGDTNPWDDTAKNFEYVSGRIESKSFFGPSELTGENIYIISSRIKLPSGHGMWPAFWLYADPWPTLGELDILEARGNNGQQFQFNMFYGTEPNTPINQKSKKVYNGSEDLRGDFHVYELIWQESKVQIALDGNVVITVNSNNNNLKDIFGNKLSIVLNTAVGGVFFSDTNSANYADQSEMKIDWVRVYKK